MLVLQSIHHSLESSLSLKKLRIAKVSWHHVTEEGSGGGGDVYPVVFRGELLLRVKGEFKSWREKADVTLTCQSYIFPHSVLLKMCEYEYDVRYRSFKRIMVIDNEEDQGVLYYYSGFGPNWGKKRGSGNTISNKYNEPTKIVRGENKIKEMSSGDEDKVNIGKGKKNMYEPEVSEVGPTKLKFDDDADDYDDKKGRTGKKRSGKDMKVRKAIKARSFKSLI
ncbi:hypothetical protein Tco_0212152 [Tanacetum coccineum]